MKLSGNFYNTKYKSKDFRCSMIRIYFTIFQKNIQPVSK